jgi:hypothetical protein
MKKKCAVFTIVKNEKYFLPIWINHYKRYFDSSDIYILDHQSDDHSTNNLDVNVITVENELAFDHNWLCQTVIEFQRKLLEEYTCVLFAEGDEIIYSVDRELNKAIDDFIISNFRFIRCKGYEIVQLEDEKNLLPNESIINNRDYWFYSHLYSKTLLSKDPLIWDWGFHTIKNYENDKITGKFGLTLCHLHRIDFELMLERHRDRIYKLNTVNDDCGGQNKTFNREDLLEYFNEYKYKNFLLEQIPIMHKNRLKI